MVPAPNFLDPPQWMFFLGKLSEVRRLRLGHCWSTGIVVIPLRTWWWVRSKLEMWTCPNLGALEVVILKDLKRKLCDWLAGLEFRATEMLDQRKKQVHQVYILLSYIASIVSPDVGFTPKCASGFSAGEFDLSYFRAKSNLIIFAKKPWNKPPKKTPLAPDSLRRRWRERSWMFFPHGILIFDGFLSLIFPKETLFYHQPMDGQAAGSLTVALPDPRLMIAKLVYKPHENYSYKYHKP